ncbi:MAG: hypothetical protein LKK36_04415 [Ewingella americana]|jgi:hypothetical protein|uniref:hypothetical protein n=1 Tax=Ewingella americana TaxID=41202 RepID=UPI002432F893|nr:hypothetical protein [Ewingella americana]MCI1677037.1 hypothetical protein [Ewingella americana]MCI1853373.1 hypothetical protein [Ewingella americana]MCI1860386.1 hypothetical protein [Ewingella americana]MCI2141405.1 hypothetical protein [Ewingella americana]MCI2162920.1 hypothetical protein [Ewingella americana]
MKTIRLLILLILSITLPSLGLASMNLMAQCNLMTETSTSASTMSMSSMAGMSGMEGMPDDCMASKSALSSSHGKQQSGQTCKFGSNCNLNTILTSFAPLNLSAPYQADAQPTPETPFSPPLEGQWRPPRLA